MRFMMLTKGGRGEGERKGEERAGDRIFPADFQNFASLPG